MHLFHKHQDRRSAPLSGVDLGMEMAGLNREYQGLIQQRRIEWLNARLGPGMVIRRSDCGFCGDRLALWLDNGGVLVLRLLWPERRPLVLLESIRWNVAAGWEVRMRTELGETVTCSAWRASLMLASEMAGEPVRRVARQQRRSRS